MVTMDVRTVYVTDKQRAERDALELSCYRAGVFPEQMARIALELDLVALYRQEAINARKEKMNATKTAKYWREEEQKAEASQIGAALTLQALLKENGL